MNYSTELVEGTNGVLYSSEDLFTYIEVVSSGMVKETRVTRENNWPLVRRLTTVQSEIESCIVRGHVILKLAPPK